MKKLLEELWYCEFGEKFKEINGEQKELLELIIQNKKKLNETLDEKEKDTLEKLEDSIHELNDLYQKEAFFKGVRLATSFICEALYDNS